MGAFLSYSIVSGMLLLAMFAAYRLFMAGDNLTHEPRCTSLHLRAVVSLASINRSPAFPPPLHGISRTGGRRRYRGYRRSPSTRRSGMGPGTDMDFIAGMAITSLRTLMTWARIIRVISKGERIRKKGYTLVLTGNSGMAPFSWMHYMVMSRDDHATCPDAITCTNFDISHAATGLTSSWPRP